MRTTWSSGRLMYVSHKLATRASFAVTVFDRAWVSTRAVATAVYEPFPMRVRDTGE